MQPKLCATDTCGKEIDDEQVYCSGDCRMESEERRYADEQAGSRVQGQIDRPAPDEKPRSPLTKDRRELRACFWCNGDFTGPWNRSYCSAACKMAA